MTQHAHHPEHRQPEQVSLWEPAPRWEPAPEPPPVAASLRPRPPWYRRTWFVGLVVVAVSATAGAVLGSHLP
jgi:ferric-dicitrate binding protein FerR (iron transport regulator)